MMTLTSIGYGDISPFTNQEYIVGLAAQGVGGIIWAMCLGTITAVLTTADPGAIRFRNMMDELNHMMSVRKFDSDTQKRVRLFFIQARGVHEAQAHRNILSAMSPQLRGEIA